MLIQKGCCPVPTFEGIGNNRGTARIDLCSEKGLRTNYAQPFLSNYVKS